MEWRKPLDFHGLLLNISDFTLYLIVGVTCALFLALWLWLGKVNEVAALFSRGPSKWFLVSMASYFIHASWDHLKGNFLHYVLAVLIIFIITKGYLMKEEKYKRRLVMVDNWLHWTGLQLILMFSIGVLDLYTNPFYHSGVVKQSYGMSELVEAVLTISIAFLFLYAADQLVEKKPSRRSLIFAVFSIILAAFLSFKIVETCVSLAFYFNRANVIAHLYGVGGGGFSSLWILGKLGKRRISYGFFVYFVFIALLILLVSLMTPYHVA